MKVLVVDDDKRIRKMLADVISDLASEIIECDDGAEALASYEIHRPDWVLMDLRMPNVDGITATRQITSEFADAKILILTSYDSPALREAARSAGAIDYLLKENVTDIRAIVSPNAQLR